ncbi:polysaccharide pyruvyl transferase family protein [Mariniflexile soesokkakense]|uniref:Polysaccharide pyruvyl transferase family protein n=1 Tax=Mariniflexile soesokkakense TaxID=1343160 RepID=A0ABV0AEZ6_9FLAO
MKYGVLTYPGFKTNFVGDYVQSLAARQYLPSADVLIDREQLESYQGDEIKLIMNGWFTHNYHHWVPSDKITPFYVAFHMNSSAAPYMFTEKGIAHLKKHEPIGCRDKYTVQILKKKGIDAYFTGCLTLTLDNYKVDDTERGDDIYIVDPFFNYPTLAKARTLRSFVKAILTGEIFKLGKVKKQLEKIVDEDVLKTAKYISQVPREIGLSEQEKLDYAENCLKKYAKAKLVITSRIHCALPCLAMGTPVIFLNSFNDFVDTCRFDGILELFNRIDVADDGSFKANFNLSGKINKNTMVTNLGLHHKLAEPLKVKVKNFIKN